MVASEYLGHPVVSDDRSDREPLSVKGSRNAEGGADTSPMVRVNSSMSGLKVRRILPHSHAASSSLALLLGLEPQAERGAQFCALGGFNGASPVPKNTADTAANTVDVALLFNLPS